MASVGGHDRAARTIRPRNRSSGAPLALGFESFDPASRPNLEIASSSVTRCHCHLAARVQLRTACVDGEENANACLTTWTSRRPGSVPAGVPLRASGARPPRPPGGAGWQCGPSAPAHRRPGTGFASAIYRRQVVHDARRRFGIGARRSGHCVGHVARSGEGVRPSGSRRGLARSLLPCVRSIPGGVGRRDRHLRNRAWPAGPTPSASVPHPLFRQEAAGRCTGVVGLTCGVR